MPPQSISGVVTKAGVMAKTVTLQVARTLVHPKLLKSYVRHKKYLVHDEKNQLSVGDAIRAVACRPLSARKHFTFTERIGGANAGAERRARAEQMMSAEQKERIRIEKLIKDQRSSSSQSTPSSKRP